MVRVLYFAWLRERMGRGEESMPIPPGIGTVGELAGWLRARDPAGAAAFATPSTVRAAVNKVFAPPSTLVADGDEVAFFPPVTGG